MGKATILLIEDSAAQARDTQRALNDLGYDVVLAENGLKGLKVLKSQPPDLVILDVLLPDINGHDVCRWMRLDERCRGIPVIMLTAKGSVEDKVAGLEAGADDYLPKPYHTMELNARIYAALRTKSLQDELRQKNRALEELLVRVELLAITDTLTNVYNRRRFQAILKEEFARSKRYDVPLSCVILDIDRFKEINDRLGHQVGDRVLQETAESVSKQVREVDLVARYGGDEFVAILPQTPREQAKVAAERLRKAIEKLRYPDLPQETGVTVSVGVAGLPDEGVETEVQLIRVADYALMRAKQQGRNRVEAVAWRDPDFQKSLLSETESGEHARRNA
jgi:diguanylate cyclase (GGDEF)-like protein